MMTSMLTALMTEEPIDVEKQQQLISGALPIAGLFVVVLGIALFLLWRSMRKQIANIDESLPAGADDREQVLDRRLTEEAVARGEREADEQSATPSDDPAPGSS